MKSLHSLAQVYQQNEGVVDIFALILYTNEHPHVVKVLRDEDYWAAFNELSGKNFAVFSVKPDAGEMRVPKPQLGYVGFIVPVWYEPDDNRSILEELCIDSTRDLPMILVFCEAEDDEIWQLQIGINDKTMELAYESIRETLTLLCGAIAITKVENRKNAEGMFSALKYAVAKHHDMKTIKKSVNFYEWVRGMLP